MRKVLPTDATIDKEALLDTQHCLAELIAYLTTEGGMQSIQQGRSKERMLGGEDIIATLDGMGMEPYAALIRSYLSKFRNFTKPRLAS